MDAVDVQTPSNTMFGWVINSAALADCQETPTLLPTGASLLLQGSTIGFGVKGSHFSNPHPLYFVQQAGVGCSSPPGPRNCMASFTWHNTDDFWWNTKPALSMQKLTSNYSWQWDGRAWIYIPQEYQFRVLLPILHVLKTLCPALRFDTLVIKACAGSL